MKNNLLIMALILTGFVFPVFGQDQLLVENPQEPNIFGYFVMAMSLIIVGTFTTLQVKKWRRKRK